MKISNNMWKKKHIQSIKTAYGNSPFFIHYVDELFEIINHEYYQLLELNRSLLTYFLKELNIKKNIIYTNKFIRDYGDGFLDYRNKKLNSEIFQSIYYQQTFLHKSIDLEKYSIIDLLFNVGNESKNTIISILKKNK